LIIGDKPVFVKTRLTSCRDRVIDTKYQPQYTCLYEGRFLHFSLESNGNEGKLHEVAWTFSRLDCVG
jgi:hypothetical protein